MAVFPRDELPRTELAKRHMRVIDNAPDWMKAKLRRLAADCCSREYEKTEDLDVYLDSEDFYYG